MSLRIAFTPECERAYKRLTSQQQRDVDRGMARVANDPYGCGSSQTYHKDRRIVTCGSVFVEYQVSMSAVTITVVGLHG